MLRQLVWYNFSISKRELSRTSYPIFIYYTQPRWINTNYPTVRVTKETDQLEQQKTRERKKERERERERDGRMKKKKRENTGVCLTNDKFECHKQW